jgi:hypothetical protein
MKQDMREAACSCRKVVLVCAGEPRRVYACACSECQRCTGTAFSYRAIYPDAAVVHQAGKTRSWRRIGQSGGWLEQHFCVDCGSVIFMRAEALKEAISVSVGCFEDPDFARPQKLHWASRRHRWLHLEDVEKVA